MLSRAHVSSSGRLSMSATRARTASTAGRSQLEFEPLSIVPQDSGQDDGAGCFLSAEFRAWIWPCRAFRASARSTLGTQPKGNILLHRPDHYPGGLLKAARTLAVIFQRSKRFLPWLHSY